ncbi:MAG: hypothetical protein ACK52S_08800, partial [Pirellula sp.]
ARSIVWQFLDLLEVAQRQGGLGPTVDPDHDRSVWAGSLQQSIVDSHIVDPRASFIADQQRFVYRDFHVRSPLRWR